MWGRSRHARTDPGGSVKERAADGWPPGAAKRPANHATDHRPGAMWEENSRPLARQLRAPLRASSPSDGDVSATPRERAKKCSRQAQPSPVWCITSRMADVVCWTDKRAGRLRRFEGGPSHSLRNCLRAGSRARIRRDSCPSGSSRRTPAGSPATPPMRWRDSRSACSTRTCRFPRTSGACP